VPGRVFGHEVGLQTSVAAVVLGACAVERHVTLDRAMWGSDQAASIEPQGIMRLVRDIRVIEKALGDGRKRVYESELPVLAKLRRQERDADVSAADCPCASRCRWRAHRRDRELHRGRDEEKSLFMRDVDAVFEARRHGLIVGLVTGEETPWVDFVARRLAIELVAKGAKDKLAAVRQLAEARGIGLDAICYVGDGDRDAPALAAVGLGWHRAILAPRRSEQQRRSCRARAGEVQSPRQLRWPFDGARPRKRRKPGPSLRRRRTRVPWRPFAAS